MEECSTGKEGSSVGLSGEEQSIGDRELCGEALHKRGVFRPLIVHNARRIPFKWRSSEDIEDFVSHTLLKKFGG
jgi:hypothetical protein